VKAPIRIAAALALCLTLCGCPLALLFQVGEYALGGAAAGSTLLKNECNGATIGTVAAGQPVNCGPATGEAK